MALPSLILVLLAVALPFYFYLWHIDERQRAAAEPRPRPRIATGLVGIFVVVLLALLAGPMIQAGDQRGWAILALVPITVAIQIMVPLAMRLARAPREPAGTVIGALSNRVGRQLIFTITCLVIGIFSFIELQLILAILFNQPFYETTSPPTIEPAPVELILDQDRPTSPVRTPPRREGWAPGNDWLPRH